MIVFAAATVALFGWAATGTTQPAASELAYPSGWIGAAIAYGRASDPKPYVLRAPSTSGVATSLVYTPFVRLAILARQAENAGRTLQPREIPASIVEPVVYVRFFDLLPDTPESCEGAPYVFGMIPSGQIPPEQNLSRPLWVRDVSRSVLYSNPEEAETRSFLPVAAFPLGAVRVGYDFVVYRTCRSVSGSWRSPNLRGVIRDEDLRTWR